MKQGDIVWVRWMDIRTDLSTDEYKDPIESISIGYIGKQSKKTLWLKSSWYTDGKEWPAKDTITIPKGCIEEVRILK
jgi:hypothetical protein